MDKKLPSIFKNTNTKPIYNNKKVFYSLDKETEIPLFEDKKETEIAFNVLVEIETYKEIITTKIVSKIKDHILTSNNRIIKLNEIKSIKRKVS